MSIFRTVLFAVFFCVLTGHVFAQASSYIGDGPPSGACGYPGATGIDRLNGNLYVCSSDGTWHNQGPVRNMPIVVAMSAAPVFNLAACPVAGICSLVLNLTSNAVVSLSGLTQGMQIVLAVCNTNVSYTWTPPAAMHGVMMGAIGPGTCNVQEFVSLNGQTLLARSGGVNEAP